MREEAELFIEIATCDWLVTKHWNRLHAVLEWSQDDRDDMAEDWAVLHPVRLACGRMAAMVFIPGVFTRMGAMRCTGCCRKTGLPPGKGSPKNSADCRHILGLPSGLAKATDPASEREPG